MSRLKLRKTWRGMHARCYDRTHIGWQYYGERGIKVCPEWNDFEQFFSWARAEYLPGLTLERRDNALGYSPDNCTWATPKQQARNRRSNVTATIDGQTKPLAEWIEDLGLSRHAVYKRVGVYGWTPEEALTPLRRENHKKIYFSGESLDARQWGLKYGIDGDTILRRLRTGWSVERALTQPHRYSCPPPFALDIRT